MDSLGASPSITAAAASSSADVEDNQESVLVDVVEGDSALIDIEKDFYKANLRAVKVQKIENEYLWNLFRAEVDLMRDHRKEKEPGYALNMRGLYHGTSAPLEQIVEEGLDNRLSRKGHFGRGIYFSDDPLKCLQYTEGSGPQYMLRCRVLLGDSKEFADGQSNVSLIREPYKKTYKGVKIYYDSVCGKPRDHMEYVVYERRRVLLEHVIYYEEKGQTGRTTVNGRPKQQKQRILVEDDKPMPKQQLYTNSTTSLSSQSVTAAATVTSGKYHDENDDIGSSGSVRRKQPRISSLSPKNRGNRGHLSLQEGEKEDMIMFHDDVVGQGNRTSSKSKKMTRRLVDSDSGSEDDIFSNYNQTSRESKEENSKSKNQRLNGRRPSLDIEDSDEEFDRDRRSSIERDGRPRRSSIEINVRPRRSSIERDVRPRRLSIERASEGRSSSIERDYHDNSHALLRNVLPRTNIEIPYTSRHESLSNDNDGNDEEDISYMKSKEEFDYYDAEVDMTEDDINIVTDNLIIDFLMVTDLKKNTHLEVAKRFIKLANFDLQRAIQLYYDNQ